MEEGTFTKKFGAAQNLRHINRRAECSYSLERTKINTRRTRKGKYGISITFPWYSPKEWMKTRTSYSSLK